MVIASSSEVPEPDQVVSSLDLPRISSCLWCAWLAFVGTDGRTNQRASDQGSGVPQLGRVQRNLEVLDSRHILSLIRRTNKADVRPRQAEMCCGATGTPPLAYHLLSPGCPGCPYMAKRLCSGGRARFLERERDSDRAVRSDTFFCSLPEASSSENLTAT